MGLSARLARYAASAPRSFLVDVPGGARTRTVVDGELRRRGWFEADAPTSADLLVVCGDPGTDLAGAVHTAWEDVPGPRAWAWLPSDASVPAVRGALDRAVAELADIGAQRDQAMARAAAGPWRPEEAPVHHGGHDEHGMHGHHMMGAPGGLAMADRAPDRDGLKLDVLRVPLGPVLRDWPAGLKVTLTLQGDVVQAAEVHVLAGGPGSAEGFWDEPWRAAARGEAVTRGEAERRRAAAHLDSLARFLGVAGWRDQAGRARVLRDAVLAGGDAGGFDRFARRTARSRALRWMTRKVGEIDPATVTRYGLTGPVARRPGDAAARVTGWLTEIREALAAMDDPSPLDDDEGPRGPVGREPSARLLAALPSLLDGAELASARLVVASLDPDITQATAMTHG
ncbi:hypothetical protein Acsp03_55580 [Actinomadura sp. NBRC 104412]|uniref:hypothetical protein n=1 Tax=Actinomadura sp. NBRC 104412 TaxID=3032203 RepID=UPI0024A1D46F|nr:hypothetical protein [Actinomadura sp. NBRC 104412]GLZ08092.1 hypothetical protein Acsp03_55580 [Actinomadura sp. NBRC 104412]